VRGFVDLPGYGRLSARSRQQSERRDRYGGQCPGAEAEAAGPGEVQGPGAGDGRDEQPAEGEQHDEAAAGNSPAALVS